ncbi:hypothetical protein TGGT1_282150 [Toxoplasma gondii GT1]|uniref:Uncharacterized protein n=2 Tax=Toxoplasma gondii TaxID=5811 RepID=S7UW76_TOXGG|nr:hypothetical protein TGGT1_282150 [Toxoplasma gondii GT1]KAF4643080.1 hypothetical protein TGRH88_038090 [Toxoplasma gondii]
MFPLALGARTLVLRPLCVPLALFLFSFVSSSRSLCLRETAAAPQPCGSPASTAPTCLLSSSNVFSPSPQLPSLFSSSSSASPFSASPLVASSPGVYGNASSSFSLFAETSARKSSSFRSPNAPSHAVLDSSPALLFSPGYVFLPLSQESQLQVLVPRRPSKSSFPLSHSSSSSLLSSSRPPLFSLSPRSPPSLRAVSFLSSSVSAHARHQVPFFRDDSQAFGSVSRSHETACTAHRREGKLSRRHETYSSFLSFPSQRRFSLSDEKSQTSLSLLTSFVQCGTKGTYSQFPAPSILSYSLFSSPQPPSPPAVSSPPAVFSSSSSQFSSSQFSAPEHASEEGQSRKHFAQTGEEKVVSLPPGELPTVSWKDVKHTVEGPPKPPLFVTPDGTYDPDRPKPEEPFGNLVALDPASSLLLQLPHALPGDALLRLHTERKSRESGGRLTERGRDTNRGRNDDSDGTATLQTDTTAKEEKAFPEDLTPLDIQEAEGGAWVRGKWMSDEEIDRAIQEGEQRIQPLVEEVQAEIEERERKQEERENAEEHPHFTDEEVDRMDLFEMKNELRLRGYRTAGPVETVRLRLKQAVRDGPRSFEEGTQEDLPESPLTRSFIEDSQRAAQTYQDALEEISRPIENPADPAQIVRRWIARTELCNAAEDPVSYFHLDAALSDQRVSAADVAQVEKEMQEEERELTDEEKQELFQQQMRDLMAETVPKTFQPRDDDSIVVDEPVKHAENEWDHLTVEERKRKYLEGNPNGVVTETVQSLAEAFSVPEDFIGDFLCRQGVQPPVPVDVPLKELTDPAAVWNLVEYLQVQDPAQVHNMYPLDTVEQIAEEFNCSVQYILDACEALKIKLPFGTKSRLNVECYDAVTTLVEKMLFPDKKDGGNDVQEAVG